MRLAKSLALPVAALGLAVAAPAAAQGGVVAGTAVRDTSGAQVGTVVRVDGEHLVVRTDRHEARLPASSFAKGEGGLRVALTRAEINERVERAKAEADAKIAPGAAVRGPGGVAVGTVEAVDEGSVTVRLAAGGAVRLPRSAMGAGESGVFTRLGAAELAREAAKAPGL